ncbi:MAG: YfiR family protein [Oleispira antarctica]|uniref:Transmembrane protein n=1 Tax=Oleispira antarctica RB-8 TaxID=698738 RepID=R4YN60_OLEAN|nr:YfiR family protein [Oleispira antarctica]MBQ0792267.1 YfiR family protein [Oleispira antarctica]CCK74518.1 conserved hypothetical protein [Oleispira antarctica RB-8]|tara:strand:- start:4106 stop:4648 length:543 start_codon:yes stop_codon:yes gene_type:complete
MPTIIFRLIFLPILLSAFSAESSEHLKEETLKVNYLLQLTKFIHWPNTLIQRMPLKLCLFENTPAKDIWQKIHLQRSQGHEIQLSYINQNNSLSECDILFIHKLIPNSMIQKNYYSLVSNSVLTIGEREDFAKDGGVIEFTLTDKHVDIKINLKTAIEAGLSINANLIEIASNVYQQGQI